VLPEVLNVGDMPILNSFIIFNFFTNKIKNLKYSIGIELLYGIFGSFFLVISYYLVFCAVEFNGTISEIGIVIPFIILSFLIPVGMAGIGGYQFIAIFIFSFIMDNSSIIASGSLIFSMLLLIINGFLGIYFINQNVAIITKLFKK